MKQVISESGGTKRFPSRVQYLRWLKEPLPTRPVTQDRYDWIADVVVGAALVFIGYLFAVNFAHWAYFLDPMALGAGLLIGWYPTGLWMHYCGWDRRSFGSVALLLSALLVLVAMDAGDGAFTMLPLAGAVAGIGMLVEHVCAKHALEWLYHATPQKRVCAAK
ncbi:MAG: hypothetical protein HKN47_17195 [Pirellulaceae bacterium]|nr:hypothetical protein [Pirellulaceae bacterium]